MRHQHHSAAPWAALPIVLLTALARPAAAADPEAPDFIAQAQISGWFKTGTNGGFGIECLQMGRNFSLDGPGEGLSGSSECAGLKTANARGLATASVTLNSVGASTYLAQGPEASTWVDSTVTASASILSGIIVRPRPGVVPTPLVETSLPFNLSGSLIVNGPPPHFLSGAGGQSLATVHVSVSFAGQTFTDTRAASFPAFEAGFPADDPNSQMLESGQSPSVFLPVNTRQPFQVTLTALSSVLANGWASGYFTSSVSYAHTLTFGRDGHVFNLPEGYTVDAPGLGIIDNRYIGAVPEPASAVMLAAGLGLWWLGVVGSRARLGRKRT